MKKIYLLSIGLLLFTQNIFAQQTVARRWNEVLLEAIRNDFARPTVHARNLFHISAAMYDCWAVYDPLANPYFLGREVSGFEIPFSGVAVPQNISNARNEALSFACYRLIKHRFEFSPDYVETFVLADNLMTELGYDASLESKLYSSGSPAALGNYLADQIIQFGLQDGSNEIFDYDNLYYLPQNPPLIVNKPGSQGIQKPNSWQPLSFDVFIDQSGNEIPGFAPAFLGPEWGNTVPFALKDEDKTIFTKNGDDYIVYHDPGSPALIDPTNNAASHDYKWGFSLVSIWSSHLDATNETMIDISPGGIGGLNLSDLPTNIPELQGFYNQFVGGDTSTGYTTNPKTGQPYEEQIVPRGDYARVLAEFWADGPDSETPPGHWFTLINYINDHPELVKKFKGEGDELGNFEWEVKSYFLLGGAMHDAAISAWGIKGYYDYVRPISAIRYMADQGQSSDNSKPNYNEAGIPLFEGYIELVEAGDPLAGPDNVNVDKIKLYAWKGPDYISDPNTDVAGVDWILAENWSPYQRPTFVTPPFAGYVSGHSTYSRAAAKVLTLLTNDEYFPGGIGEFEAKKNKFLVFEDGPSMDITLQWAKYNDASDQCSLSRIWGGIHPPTDDIPGRLIGEQIGIDAFEYAEKFFTGRIILGTNQEEFDVDWEIYPNPVSTSNTIITIKGDYLLNIVEIELIGIDGKLIKKYSSSDLDITQHTAQLQLPKQSNGTFIIKFQTNERSYSKKLWIK